MPLRQRSATTAGRRRSARSASAAICSRSKAWRDDYASLCHEIEVKHKAGVDIALELTEARQYLEQVLPTAVPCKHSGLGTAIKALEGDDVEAACMR